MSVEAIPTHNTGADAQGRRLESWKEIALYLGRDVTTVRRWEKREGLPVHRLHTTSLDRFTPTRRNSTRGAMSGYLRLQEMFQKRVRCQRSRRRKTTTHQRGLIGHVGGLLYAGSRSWPFGRHLPHDAKSRGECPV